MTSATGAKIEEPGHAPNSGSTTLHGRIEAIGIHDLLRVSTGKASTGRLLVFNDTSDAEIYYEQGRLVAVISGASFGAECLQQVLRMQEGEFEFAVGLQTTDESKTPNLHEAMIGSIREHYEQQVRNRQAVRTSNDEPRSSGVHKIENQDASSGASTPTSSPAPSRAAAPKVAGSAPTTSASAPSASPSSKPTSATPGNAAPQRTPAPPASAAANAPVLPSAAAKAPLLPGELGNAVIDPSGRVLQRQGALTQHEAALAALGLKLAIRLGASLGARDSQGLELHASGEKALFCIAAAEGIRISKLSPDADPDTIWKQLKS